MLSKNRFLALVLSLAVLCAMLPLGMMNAFAAGTQPNANSLPLSTTTRFFVPETHAGKGAKNVTLSLTYETEDSIQYGMFVVEFPSDMLRLITPMKIDGNGDLVSDPNRLSPMPTVVVNVDRSGKGIVKVAFSTAESLPESGTLIDLPFEVVDPSSEGEYTITVWAKEWCDEYGNNHAATSSITDSGNVIVKSMSSGDFEYTLINAGTEVQIIGYTGEDGAVVIPDTLDGKPVTSIGNGAFENCASFTSVTIPSSVTKIERDAFYNCDAFTIYADLPSHAYTYAWENGIPFVALAVVQLRDEQSGVQTEYADGSSFEGDILLSVKPIKEESILGFLKDYEAAYVLDITLLQNGEMIQPASPLNMRIPVPANIEFEGCRVLHIADDGTLTDMSATPEGDMMVFVINHFSYYAVVGNAVPFGDVNKDDKVNTTDARYVLQYAAGIIADDDLGVRAADVNGDGKVNTTDARSVLQFAAGIIDHFPVEKDK